MNTFSALIGMILIGVAAWFLAENNEKKKNNDIARLLKRKLQNSEGRVFSLTEQIQKLEANFVGVQKSLDEQRTQHIKTLREFHGTFKKGILISGLSCLIGGVAFGSIFGASLTGAHNQQQILELRVVKEVAEHKTLFIAEQLKALKEEFNDLRLKFDEEREAKILALTKLEIVLKNLVSDKWGKGFSADLKKLRKTLNHSHELDSLEKTTSIVTSSLPRF